MTLLELEKKESNYYFMEDSHLKKLSMATSDYERVFLRSQLCHIRGLQADARIKRLELKTEN